MQNIQEEFGGHAFSHEVLYLNFAKSLGVDDLEEEILNHQTYLPSIQAFNKGHLRKLMKHKWEHNLSAFAAYERLDNVDYANLMELIKNLGVLDKDSIFFKVHMFVEHFETSLPILFNIWVMDKETVIDAFNFIASHQLEMWENLSNAITECSHVTDKNLLGV